MDVREAREEEERRRQDYVKAQERIAEEQRRRAEAERQRAIEAEAGRRRARRLAMVAGAFALLALVGAAAAGWNLWQANMARERAELGELQAKRAQDQLQQALGQVQQALAKAEAAESKAQLGDSLFRADQARNQLQDGLPVTATQLALAGLPDDLSVNSARTWVGEAAGALVEAMGEQRKVLVLRGHEGSVYAAQFSPDGARIVSGSGTKLCGCGTPRARSSWCCMAMKLCWPRASLRMVRGS